MKVLSTGDTWGSWKPGFRADKLDLPTAPGVPPGPLAPRQGCKRSRSAGSQAREAGPSPLWRSHHSSPSKWGRASNLKAQGGSRLSPVLLVCGEGLSQQHAPPLPPRLSLPSLKSPRIFTPWVPGLVSCSLCLPRDCRTLTAALCGSAGNVPEPRWAVAHRSGSWASVRGHIALVQSVRAGTRQPGPPEGPSRGVSRGLLMRLVNWGPGQQQVTVSWRKHEEGCSFPGRTPRTRLPQLLLGRPQLLAASPHLCPHPHTTSL